MIPPSDCSTMAQIRAGIDRIDAELIALLTLRARHIDRAAQIKAEADLPARIPARVEEVVANVRALAIGSGLDPDLAETLWRQLIDWSIAREETSLGPDSARPENQKDTDQ